MALAFYIASTIFFTIAVIQCNIKTKYWLALPNILFISVCVNFLLYLCGWSLRFVEPVYDRTYYVIGTLQLIFGIVTMFYKRPEKLGEIQFKRIKLGQFRGFSIAAILLSLCILLCAIENLYLHGGLFASNYYYHTASMPLVGPILKALYPVSYIVAFIEFTNSKSKSVLVLFVVSIVYSVVGSQGRFWTICSFLSVLVFASLYEKPALRKKKKEKGWFASLKLRYKLVILTVSILAFNYLMTMGVNRINMFTYADIIGYSGPWKDTALGESFAWYYGYFPFSFYNLNTTIQNIYDHNILSLGSFLAYPFLSLINLEGVFGIDYTALTKTARVIQNNAATVATGYFESVSDFHELFAISILVLLSITYMCRKRVRLSNYISYSYMLVVWLFMSFLNMFTVGIPLYVFIISAVINRIFVRESDHRE